MFYQTLPLLVYLSDFLDLGSGCRPVWLQLSSPRSAGTAVYPANILADGVHSMCTWRLNLLTFPFLNPIPHYNLEQVMNLDERHRCYQSGEHILAFHQGQKKFNFVHYNLMGMQWKFHFLSCFAAIRAISHI